jgi:hypothetical protein
MSDPANEMEWQLRKLMEIAAGEPTRRITIETVRHLARRRTIAAVSAAVAVVLIGGAGAAVAARTAGRQPVSATSLPSGVPRYYYEDGVTNAGHEVNVIRATTTGAITATVHCPAQGSHVRLTSVIPIGLHTFFMMCQSFAGPRPSRVVTASRIYGFRLTGTGRINGYFRVRGGALGALNVYWLTATPDGARVAVLVPPGSKGPSSPPEILVIDTHTGAHTLWIWPKEVLGTIYFGLNEASFTGNGNELAVLGPARCIKGKTARKCKSTAGEEVRAFNIAGPGGQIGQGRILLRQSAIMPTSVDYINDVVISPDGSTLTLTEVGSGIRTISSFVKVLAVSAANSKNRHVIFTMNTGDGFSYNFFSADPSRRYFILDAGPSNGTRRNGWIYHGRLVPLKPTPGDNVFDEAW